MSRLARTGAGAAIALAVVGCLFPEYTFDETSSGGGGATTTSSSSTTSSGSQTTTTGVASGGGGAGGMSPEEDCFTAGDEDGDQLADCADPDCEPDVECVDSIPVGWGGIGYVALFRGTAGADPACPPGTETVVYTGNATLQNTSASCTSCGCAAPAWSSCELYEDFDTNAAGLQALYPGNQTCGSFTGTNGTLTVPSPWAPNVCTALGPYPGGNTCGSPGPAVPCNAYVDIGLARPFNGSCASTGGAPANASPTWQDEVKACRVVEGLGGCTAPQACVPKPQGVYEPRICIGRAGDQTCPGAFTQLTTAHGDFDDTRDCTGCSCGAATGGSCTLNVTLYSDAGCNTPVGSGSSNTCAMLNGNPAVQRGRTTVVTPPSGGSCPVVPGGGQPTGGVTETDPTTFCCLP
ncbi:MAG: hypothetical protein JNL21_01110 [Myxococcales bacterium]|nr:hypothetical protein [Myxococcales bacterium]